jgi:hypothetical protein
MHALATFDRWFNQRCPTPSPEAERLLRAAHGASSVDWLGLLADEREWRGGRFSWRLALWRAGGQPQWLGPPLRAQAGQTAASLRREALQQALTVLRRR